MTTRSLEEKKGTGKQRVVSLNNLTSRFGRICISKMIVSIWDRRLLTGVIAVAKWRGRVQSTFILTPSSSLLIIN